MILVLLLACTTIHKTSLSGVIDRTSGTRCTIELDSGNVITINSVMCAEALEGDRVSFYVGSKLVKEGKDERK